MNTQNSDRRFIGPGRDDRKMSARNSVAGSRSGFPAVQYTGLRPRLVEGIDFDTASNALAMTPSVPLVRGFTRFAWSRRLLSLAAVRDGMDRASTPKIGGMDRQTLRDWVHRFNASGPEGLIDNWTEGPKPRLSADQLAEFAAIVETRPDREKDGVVRWRRVDLKRVIAERFGVEFHERYVGKLLKKLGFSHMSARPRHPAQGRADRRSV